MLKKSLLVAAAAALLLGLLFGRDAVSYVGASVAQLHQSVKDNVPIEFELERARREIKHLTPEIRKNIHAIAAEEVELDRIAASIESLETKLAKEEGEIMTLKDDLKSGESFVYYNDKQFSQDEVRTDLERRFETFKTMDATLSTLHKQYDARKKSLDAASDKLAAMKAAKEELIVTVDNLEARMKMVEVAKTTSDLNLDDSRLARTKELINEIDNRIKTEEKMLNHIVESDYRIPVSKPEPTKDVSQEIDEYFGSTDKSVVNFKVQ